MTLSLAVGVILVFSGKIGGKKEGADKMAMSETTVETMVKRIVEKFQPIKVIVFGSWVTGAAGPDSDADFLVVMDCNHAQKRDLQVAIRKELRDFEIPKDILVATPGGYRKV